MAPRYLGEIAESDKWLICLGPGVTLPRPFFGLSFIIYGIRLSKYLISRNSSQAFLYVIVVLR